LTPSSFADVKGLKVFPFALPEGSVVYADWAYTDYAVEDLLLAAEQITLSAMRKSNSRRPFLLMSNLFSITNTKSLDLLRKSERFVNIDRKSIDQK
jgi:hypothetical protein